MTEDQGRESVKDENRGRQFIGGQGLTRRQLMAEAARLGVALPFAVSVLAATGTARAADPTPGGQLRIGFKTGTANDTADPAKSYHAGDHARMRQLYNTLTGTGPDLVPRPELAERWEADESGQRWKFFLRKDVQFHDGRPLRAADAVYSLRRLLDPAVASPYRSLVAPVVDADAISADGDSTVLINLKAPYADLPSLLANYNVGIVPENFTAFDHAVGTGPFKLKEFKPGISTTLVRNENYWKKGLPYLDGLELRVVADPVARVNGLLSGELDMVEALDAKSVDLVNNSPNAAAFRSPSGYHVPIVMEIDQPPFDKPEVRAALKLLIDRERVLKLVYNGLGQVGNDQPIAPVYPFYCSDLPQRQRDVAKAKELLAKAGASDLSVELHCSDAVPGGVALATLYSQMAAEGGVTVKVIRDPSDGYWKSIWLKVPFSVSGWNMRATADIMLSLVYESGATWNETHWKNPEFDKLLADGRQTLDAAKRKDIYCQAQRLISDDGGVIVPVFIDLLDGVSKKIQGLVPYPTGAMGEWHWEEVWLQS
jgi:peptide/nickel transport system substrate-binding protein